MKCLILARAANWTASLQQFLALRQLVFIRGICVRKIGCKSRSFEVQQGSRIGEASGSAFSANVSIPADTSKFTGDLTTCEDVGTSGKSVRRMFCNRCGSPLATDAKAYPGLLFIKGGTLDDVSWAEPGLEIWRASAQGWVQRSSTTQTFPGNPG